MAIQRYSTPIEDPILTALSIGRLCPTSLDFSPFRCMDNIMLEEVLSGVPHKALICSDPTGVLGKKRKAAALTTSEGPNDWWVDSDGGVSMDEESSQVIELIDLVSDSEKRGHDVRGQWEDTASSSKRIVVFGLPASNGEFAALMPKERGARAQGKQHKLKKKKKKKY